MRESLLHKMFAPIRILILLCLLLNPLIRRTSFLEAILLHRLRDLLHNIHESLTQKGIVLNQRNAILIFLHSIQPYPILDLFILDELGLYFDEGDVDAVDLELVLGELAQLLEFFGLAMHGELPVAYLLEEGELGDLV